MTALDYTFQRSIEILLLLLIFLMGIGIVNIIFRERMQPHTHPTTMPEKLTERGDYLLALIKEGDLVLENRETQ